MYPFILALIIGVAVRISLLFIPSFKVDIDSFAAWADRLAAVGLSNFYSNNYFSDYTPGYLYILYILGKIKVVFGLDQSSFITLLKIPSIICDLILASIIYFQVKKISRGLALISSCYILFNPGLIFNSTVWGQVDSFLTTFMVLAILFLKKKSFYLASLFLSLAILIKPQALPLGIVFLFFLFKNFSFTNFLKLTLPGFLTLSLLTLPFMKDSVLGMFTLIQKTAAQYPYTSLFAFNIWGATVGTWINDQTKFLFLTYQQIGVIFFGIYTTVILFALNKKPSYLYTFSALIMLGFFFLPTRVHERYLYPALVFLPLSLIELKNGWIFRLQYVLSFLYFVNLYFVYVYYNEFYYPLPKILYIPGVYEFIQTNFQLISAFESILFIMIMIIYLKQLLYEKENLY